MSSFERGTLEGVLISEGVEGDTRRCPHLRGCGGDIKRCPHLRGCGGGH